MTTTELLTTAEAAARMGRSHNNFASQAAKRWGLEPVKQLGNAKFFDPADVDAAIEKRAAAKVATRAPKRTEADANDAMLRGLIDSASKKLTSADNTLTEDEQAVVWAAYLAGTLGPDSPYRHATPPLGYQRAYEARGARKAKTSQARAAGRADALEAEAAEEVEAAA